jgi:hypothetical protein
MDNIEVREGDVVERKERDEDVVVWVREGALLGWCEDLTEDYLRKKCRYAYKKGVPLHRQGQDVLPNTGGSWRWGLIRGSIYYAYPNLGPKYRAQLPGAEVLVQLQAEYVSGVRQSGLAMAIERGLSEGYRSYLAYYTGERKAVVLAKAAVVLETAAVYIQTQAVDVKKSVFWKDFAVVVNVARVEGLPKHWRLLQGKVLELLEGQSVTAVIKAKNKGNSNAEKDFDKSVLLGWAAWMQRGGANYTVAHLVRKFQLLCPMMGWEDVPSERTIGTLIDSEAMRKILSELRFGSRSRYANPYKGYIPIETAVFAGDCVQMDATRFQVIPHKSVLRRPDEGATDVAKPRSLWLIAVRDVYSGDILGYHFDTKEDRWGYLFALKMAVQTTGHLPYELVSDRFPGHNTEEWKAVVSRLEYAGVKYKVSHKATGKAQLERWWGTLQTVFEIESDYYYGEGIKSRRLAAHRSAEYLDAVRKKAKKEDWDFDAAVREGTKIVEAYRSTKYNAWSKKYATIAKTPRELYLDSDKPNVKKVEIWAQLALFETGKAAMIKHNGQVVTTIQKVEYIYWVALEDYDVVQAYKEVTLQYDIEDLEQVYLFDRVTRDYICTVDRVRRVQVFGPDADAKAMVEAKARQAWWDAKKVAGVEAVLGGFSLVPKGGAKPIPTLSLPKGEGNSSGYWVKAVAVRGAETDTMFDVVDEFEDAGFEVDLMLEGIGVTKGDVDDAENGVVFGVSGVRKGGMRRDY